MNKNKILTGIFLVFVFGVLCSYVFLGNNEYYEKYENYKYGFFPYYSTINSKMSEEDRKTANDILLEVENAAMYVGDDPDSLGEIGYFSKENNERNVARVDFFFEVITAKFSFGNAYIWFEYNDTRYDGDGEVVSSARDCLCYLKLKKSDGVWTVTRIKETA